MEELIRKQDAIDALKQAYWDSDLQSAKNDPCVIDAMTDWAIRQVKALPAVQPERGKWIKKHWKAFRCSECNRISEYSTNFCPNCGADMRGEAE